MNIHRKVICLALVAAWCAVPAISFAGKCSGTNINNLVSWEPSEISKGTWKLSGGTGKFANAKGTAQWEFSQLQGKMAAVRWVGNCQ